MNARFQLYLLTPDGQSIPLGVPYKSLSLYEAAREVWRARLARAGGHGLKLATSSPGNPVANI